MTGLGLFVDILCIIVGVYASCFILNFCSWVLFPEEWKRKRRGDNN